MKIRLMFQDTELGTAESKEDGSIAYAGPDAEGVRRRVEFYARTSRLTGDELLRRVLDRSRGRNWAEEVGGSA